MSTLPATIEGKPVPAALRALHTALTDNGWTVHTGWDYDSADHLFVSVEAVHAARSRRAQATWHTRPTDGRALRLFSAMLWRPYIGWYALTAAGLTAAARGAEQ